MAIKSRDFLELAAKVGAGAVYAVYGSELNRLFTQAVDGDVHVIWLKGASDSGCTISLLQGAHPDLVEVITNLRLAVDFCPTLMIPSGDRVLLSLSNALAGRTPLDLLIIEGAVSSGSFGTSGEIAGRLVPFETWVKDLAAAAKQVVAVGTCAAVGGIPLATPDPTSCRPVSDFVKSTPLINIPGCPAHPDWVLLTLATVISGSVPALDDRRRPKVLAHEELRDCCRLEHDNERPHFASAPSRPGNLADLGGQRMTEAAGHLGPWNN